jgi:hypothetical protein
MRWFIVPSLLAALSLISASADDTDKNPKPNQNSLIAEYKDKLELSASTFWPGWPASSAFDGDTKTSWFSAGGDAAAFKKSPWVQVKFPDEVKVRRVTILGNREVLWPTGYTINVGKLELYDKEGKLLHSQENECSDNKLDIDFPLTKPVSGVRSVRFVSVKDEGDQNPYDDIALGEFQVE